MHGKSYVWIQSGEKMGTALETGHYDMVFTKSPEIIATETLYDNRTEFDHEDINLSQ
jgi:hypothetical protein